MRNLSLPIADDIIRSLKVGDPVQLSGTMITGRDAAHKWMVDTFIAKNRKASGDDESVYQHLQSLLAGGAIYHCGPVVSGLDDQQYRFVAAGPTTSTREEPYQSEVMHHFNVKAVIGKGGMGARTLEACRQVPGVYLHAIGGAATLIAQSVTQVHGVHKLEFGVPEAMWVIEVQDFPAVVTMDSHGESLHAEVEARSAAILQELIQR